MTSRDTINDMIHILEIEINESEELHEDENTASWGNETGILITRKQANLIKDILIERSISLA